MTCIAWDGRMLAADKRCTAGSAIATVTKIHRVGRKLVGYSGTLLAGASVLKWIREGGRFPAMAESTNGDCPVQVMVVENGVVTLYEGSPIPLVFEDPFFAIGSGRDYAIAAMHCGKDAREAVEIASLYDSDCGNGVDVLWPVEA